MTVTEIRPLDKKRSRLWIDGCASFALYQGEIRRLGIEEGFEMPEETYQEILQVLTKRAKLRGMNLLKRADQTEAGFRRKLRAGYYPEECIEEAVRYVKSYRYIDDERYARNYIAGHRDKKSRKQLFQELILRGISKEMAEEALEAEGETDEAALEKIAARRCRNSNLREAAEFRRQLRYLVSKGFEYDAALSCLRRIRGGQSEEEAF